MSEKKLLIETIQWRPTLIEGKSGGTNIRFKFAESDVANANKRIYPHKVLSASVVSAQKRIDEGVSLYGSTNHVPEMGVDDVSHRLLSVGMKGKDAVAEAAILQTSKGKNLLEILKGGGSVGVSMRGTGNTRPLAEGLVEVCDDHVLLGVDIVLSPSFDAHISAANIFESASFGDEEIDPKTLFAFYREALLAGRRESYAAFVEHFKNVRR